MRKLIQNPALTPEKVVINVAMAGWTRGCTYMVSWGICNANPTLAPSVSVLQIAPWDEPLGRLCHCAS